MQLSVNFAIEEDVKKRARARNEPLANVGVKLDIINDHGACHEKRRCFIFVVRAARRMRDDII